MENVPETSMAFISTAMRGNYLAKIKKSIKRGVFYTSVSHHFVFHDHFPLSDPYVKRAVFATVPLRLVDDMCIQEKY